MKLAKLLEKIGHLPSSLDVALHGLSLDSRTTQAGDLFFAYTGTHFNGQKFIAQALEKGAAAVLLDQTESLDHLAVENILQDFVLKNSHLTKDFQIVDWELLESKEYIAQKLPAKNLTSKHINTHSDNEYLTHFGKKNSQNNYTKNAKQVTPILLIKNLKGHLNELIARFYNYPAKDLQIIAVTGTNGKTSCTHFIAQALQNLDIPCGVIGTLGMGIYGNLIESSLTTPDPITLQKMFADFKKQGIKFVAMEVSSHSLDQGRVNGIFFKVGIFTNLTHDHLDYHKTMAAYGAAKKKLFNPARIEFALINRDDPFSEKIANDWSKPENLFTYGITNTNLKGKTSLQISHQINTKTTNLTASGIETEVHTPWGKGKLKLNLLGEFNLNNSLATLTTLCLLKIPFETALSSINKLLPVPGRMQIYSQKNSPVVVIDYSHTPDALVKALNTLRKHCHGNLYCVFGCGGDRDRNKRPLMAAIAEQHADFVLVTDDNPRTEDPEQITSEIFKGFTNFKKIILQHDRAKAIAYAIETATQKDCILIAGKGAETYQQIGNQKFPFSDIEQVEINLQKRKSRIT